MTPEQERQFNELTRKVEELTTWKAERMRQQLSLPLDPSSIEVLNQAFINSNFSKFEVKRLILTAGATDDPAVEGELVYHGTTPSIKVLLGTVKTITTA